jgi:hypothetical protein
MALACVLGIFRTPEIGFELDRTKRLFLPVGSETATMVLR